MNDVPLVNANDINSINTSIIAIKKQLMQLNEAVGLIDTPDVNIDFNPFVKKSDVVNTVQSGNMNPVTSNAVANALSYSTTEQKTGGVWLDEKPIYRKVVTGLNFGGTTNNWIDTGATLTNGETLIKTEAIRYSNNIYYILNIISFRLNGNSIQYLTPTAHSNTNILIVEYTKTTDQARHLMTIREFIEPMIRGILEEEPIEEPKEEEKK
ncbi:MAG: hypothetical protein J6S85_11560 [Methanobrevibacter sp.]|nr:hypothetical protein [Methanobrevibacter sp.]